MSNIHKLRELLASSRHNEKRRRLQLLVLWTHSSVHLRWVYSMVPDEMRLRWDEPLFSFNLASVLRPSLSISWLCRKLLRWNIIKNAKCQCWHIYVKSCAAPEVPVRGYYVMGVRKLLSRCWREVTTSLCYYAYTNQNGSLTVAHVKGLCPSNNRNHPLWTKQNYSLLREKLIIIRQSIIPHISHL